MKEDIIRQFKKANTLLSVNDSRVEVVLPSNIGRKEGKLISVFPKEGLLFNLISIHSTEIPNYIANPIKGKKELKINYCALGRCELRLKSGECTYLAAGELAIDTGQTKASFYYPSGNYEGYEVIVYDEIKESKLSETSSNASAFLYKCLEGQARPWIKTAGKFIAGFYDVFQYYTEKNLGNELIFLKSMELLTYLTKIDFHRTQLKKTYYTASQIEIAKRAKELICSDLSVRYSAKELAESFGVSETSLKNYFKSVYGCGYLEFQQMERMETSAKLLKETNQKIADIGLSVGFVTQTKFGAAFKSRFGVTPLEYRRRCRLKQ